MDAILTNTKAWVSGLAGLVLCGAAIHEWNYNRHHHYAPGPSEVLAVGFAACAAVAFAVMFVARELANHKADTYAHLTEDERKARAEDHLKRLQE